MLSRYGIAGPGPATLAYRLRRLTTKAAKRPGHASRAPHTTKTPSWHSAPTPPAAEARGSRRAGIPPEPDVLDYVPMMFAPPSHAFSQATFAKLTEALAAGDISTVAERFADLHPDVWAEQFTMQQWEAISTLLCDQPWTRPKGFRTIHDISSRRPALFGSLTTLAIEAALRNPFQGLYRLFLALLAAGKPQLIIDAYGRYRDRLMDFQGKNKADLSNFQDRAKRLAARPESPGIKPLSTVYLAALTTTNQLTTAQMVTILGSKCDWRRLDRKDEADVRDALLQGNHSATEIEKFEEGTGRFLFAVLGYHPQILLERVKAAYRRGDVSHFEWLLNSILAGSIGPDRFLIPSEIRLHAKPTNTHGILLPIDIWGAIINGLTHLKRPLDILRVVEEDLPARDIVPPPMIIATALRSLAKLVVLPGAAEEVKVAAQHVMAQVLSIVEARGLGDDDLVLSAIIDTSSIFRDYKNIADQFHRFQKTPRNIGPSTRSSMIQALLLVGKNALARQVLEWTQVGDMDIVNPRATKPYYRYASGVMRQRRPAKEIMKEIDEVIVNGKTPFGVDLSHGFVAMLLALRLDVGGAPAVEDVAERLIALARLKDGDQYYLGWQVAIDRFLSRGGPLREVKPLEAQVGLRFLEGFVRHAARHVSITRANRLWDIYLRYVTHSTRLTQGQRRHLQQQAIGLYRQRDPDGLGPPTLFTLVEGSLTRRLLYSKDSTWKHSSAANVVPANESDVEDALYWWRYIQRASKLPTDPDAPGLDEQGSNVSGYFWTKAIFAFKRAGREDVAIDLVSDAWNGHKESLAHYFWDEAEQSGLLAKAGISSDQLEQARQGAWALWSNDLRWARDPVEEGETLDEREEALTAQRAMTAEQEE